MKKKSWFTFQFAKSRGFTLIELLIVIAIIGVLSSFILANLIGAKGRARDAQRKSDLRQIQSALELYRSDQGSYPAALPSCGQSLASGSTVYIQKTPCDPLSSTGYTYTQTGAGYTLAACLESVNDKQKDPTNTCTTPNTVSYTVTNP